MKTIKEYLNEGLIKKLAGVDIKTKIEGWLNQYKIKHYNIFSDLSIRVYGNVDLTGYPEKELPDYIKFAEVMGKFIIDNSKLTSLKGCPAMCELFSCNNCDNLKSLIGLNCYCEYFYCEHCNRLESLLCDYLSVKYAFKCNDCQNLTSLEGGPKKMIGTFECKNCPGLTSLKGAPEECKLLDCSFCENLTSLDGIPKIGKIEHWKCGKSFTTSDIRAARKGK